MNPETQEIAFINVARAYFSAEMEGLKRFVENPFLNPEGVSWEATFKAYKHEVSSPTWQRALRVAWGTDLVLLGIGPEAAEAILDRRVELFYEQFAIAMQEV